MTYISSPLRVVKSSGHLRWNACIVWATGHLMSKFACTWPRSVLFEITCQCAKITLARSIYAAIGMVSCAISRWNTSCISSQTYNHKFMLFEMYTDPIRCVWPTAADAAAAAARLAASLSTCSRHHDICRESGRIYCFWQPGLLASSSSRLAVTYLVPALTW